MPLSDSALASDLDAAVSLVTTEPEAIDAWGDTIGAWFEAATANGSPAAPAGVAPATAALKSGLVGLSTAGAPAIVAGITAFWGALVPATVFPPATVIVPPPTIATMGPALLAVFASNVASGASQSSALAAIATVIYTNGFVGGTATFPAPVGVVPIL